MDPQNENEMVQKKPRWPHWLLGFAAAIALHAALPFLALFAGSIVSLEFPFWVAIATIPSFPVTSYLCAHRFAKTLSRTQLQNGLLVALAITFFTYTSCWGFTFRPHLNIH